MRQPAGGFTLLELLIALTLLGFIMVLLFSGFRLSGKSWDAAQARIDENGAMQIDHAFLKHLLSQAYPFALKKAVNQPLVFNGAADRIEFIAPIPARSAPGGFQHVLLTVEPDKEARQIAFRHQPIDYASASLNPPEGERAAVFGRGAADIRFSYFGSDDERTPGTWRDTWSNPKRMPTLVRVSVKQPAEARPWPEIVAPIRVQKAEDCVWDTFYNRCFNVPAR